MRIGFVALTCAAGLLAGCAMLNSTALVAPGDELTGLAVGATDFGGTNGADGKGHSSLFRQADASDPVRCRGKLGAYYLTKRLVPIKLVKVTASGKASYILYTGGEKEDDGGPPTGLITASDRRRGYCLDFLESATSDDLITVERHHEGYLKYISSDAKDQSARIAKTVIRTIFTAITGAPDFDESRSGTGERATAGEEPDGTYVLLNAKYDPTDPTETALINQRLGQTAGFCLVLEGQPPTSIDDYAVYCDNPIAYLERLARGRVSSSGPTKGAWSARIVDSRSAGSGQKAIHAAAKYNATGHIAEHEKDAPGIYYRPRRPFTYSVLVRQQCKQRGACTGDESRKHKLATGTWALREEKTIELENISPIIAIRVDRTFFATRKTEMKFDDGVLYDVKIRKDSELAGFVEIPLQIARSVVAIPGNLVKVRFDNTQSRTRLVAAQMLLLEQQRAYLELLEAQATATPPVIAGEGK